MLGGIWNQDLIVSNADETLDPSAQQDSNSLNTEKPKVKSGCKIMKPRYQIDDAKKSVGLRTNMPGSPTPGGLKTLGPPTSGGLKTLAPTSGGLKTLGPTSGSGLKTLPPVKTNPGAWEVLLSESSGSDNEGEIGAPKKPRIKEKSVCDLALAIKGKLKIKHEFSRITHDVEKLELNLLFSLIHPCKKNTLYYTEILTSKVDFGVFFSLVSLVKKGHD